MAYRISQARGQIGATAAAYTTATATWDPSHIWDLHHSSWQCRILNPPSEARDGTCILMDATQIRFPLSHDLGSPVLLFHWS